MVNKIGVFVLLVLLSLHPTHAAFDWTIPGVAEWINVIQTAAGVWEVLQKFFAGPQPVGVIRMWALVGSVPQRNAEGDGIDLCANWIPDADYNHNTACCSLPRHVTGGSYHIWFTIVASTSGGPDDSEYSLFYSGSMLAALGFSWQYNSVRMDISDVFQEHTHLNEGNMDAAADLVKLTYYTAKPEPVNRPYYCPLCHHGPAALMLHKELYKFNVSYVLDDDRFQTAVEHPNYRGYPILREDHQVLYLSDINQVLKPCRDIMDDNCFSMGVDNRSLAIYHGGSLAERTYDIMNV